MSRAIFFAPISQPVVDGSGRMTREWYLFFQALFNRVGGETGSPSDELDLLQAQGQVSALAERVGELQKQVDDLRKGGVVL